MKEKKKLIIATVLVLIVMIGTIGLAFAMFMYENTGGKSKLVLGDIWMKYREVEGISLSNALPGDPYSDYFEFTITGTNTYEEKDIWYEIRLNNGEVPDGKTEANRMLATYLNFKLVEVNGEEEKVLFEDRSYGDLNNKLIYIAKIPKNTKEEYNKTYRLYMKIADYLYIVDEETINSGYCASFLCITPEDYQDAFASVKVNVSGDLTPRIMPNTMAKIGIDYSKFWSDDIINAKESIKEVNFIKLSNQQINTRYNAASIKSDISTDESYPIKAWLEENESDSSMYTMYVASEYDIYTPSDSTFMFYEFVNTEIINFDNINTSQTTDMVAMFKGLKNLKSIDLSNFDTYNVISMANMFQNCTSLETLDLSMLNFDPNKNLNIYSTFDGCTNLKVLDISSFLFNKEVKPYIFTFNNVGSNLPAGTYTTVYVKPDYVLNGTTYSPQNCILSLEYSFDKPSGWSTANVIVKQ